MIKESVCNLLDCSVPCGRRKPTPNCLKLGPSLRCLTALGVIRRVSHESRSLQLFNMLFTEDVEISTMDLADERPVTRLRFDLAIIGSEHWLCGKKEVLGCATIVRPQHNITSL